MPLLGQEEEEAEDTNGATNGSTATSPLLVSQLIHGHASEKGALLEAWEDSRAVPVGITFPVLINFKLVEWCRQKRTIPSQKPPHPKEREREIEKESESLKSLVDVGH